MRRGLADPQVIKIQIVGPVSTDSSELFGLKAKESAMTLFEGNANSLMATSGRSLQGLGQEEEGMTAMQQSLLIGGVVALGFLMYILFKD